VAVEGYANEALPRLEPYAEDALRLAEPPPECSLIDVATGPGTLALMAAPRCREVVAVDFSPRMIEELKRRCDKRGRSNVRALVEDGQNLQQADSSFDRAFSMFGLMFFEDRARGFRELFRVLRSGGRAAVSSWEPFDRVPFVAELWSAVRAEMPNIPFGANQAPLGSPDVFREEMAAAGFADPKIVRLEHTWRYSSLGDAWSAFAKMTPPLIMLRHRLPGESWTVFEKSVTDRLAKRVGEGAVNLEMVALLGLGTKN
jgi:ubiquinone/menaquinone biosynthesis C-methylase UbiE